jgi:hypothetical protein
VNATVSVVAAFSRAGRLQVELEDWLADPVVGRVRSEHGGSIAFVGWLGLISAVELLRDQERAGDQPERAR